MSGQPPRNMRLAAQPRPAPPIACCSPRALGRKFGRDFNCRWMKARGQVSARRFLASDKGIYLGMRAAKQQPPYYRRPTQLSDAIVLPSGAGDVSYPPVKPPWLPPDAEGELTC